MDTLHYTIVDPQMVPADLLDLAQPQDIFGYGFSNSDEVLSEEEEEEEEEGGIMSTVARVFTSPFSLIFYLFEMILEEKINK